MEEKKRLFFILFFLFLTSCNIFDGTSLVPDMNIECSSSFCSESLEDKNVYFGITSDLDFDCEDDLVDFNDYDEFKDFFDVYQTEKGVWNSGEKALLLKEEIDSWEGDLDSNVFGFLKPAKVCAFVDVNNNEKLDTDEPFSSDSVDLGFSSQVLNKWRK